MIYDAIIIGGGPAGITAALYLVRSGCSVAFVEKIAPGGQVLKTESIENYPGFPDGIKGYELADVFAAHLNGLELDRFSSEVTKLELMQDNEEAAHKVHRVHFNNSHIDGHTVIVCSGAEHKHLGIDNELKLSGRGISYCAICDGNFFRGQEVAVVGGGNTALEESLYLSKIVKKVYLIHRREEFRGAKVYLDRLDNAENVEIIKSTVVTAIHGETDLTGLSLKNIQNGDETELPVQGFFIFVGIKPSVDFISDLVQRDAAGFLITDTEMRTNIPGLFAAGDIRSKLCRQVSTAVGDGATAAQAAFLYVEQLNG